MSASCFRQGPAGQMASPTPSSCSAHGRPAPSRLPQQCPKAGLWQRPVPPGGSHHTQRSAAPWRKDSQQAPEDGFLANSTRVA